MGGAGRVCPWRARPGTPRGTTRRLTLSGDHGTTFGGGPLVAHVANQTNTIRVGTGGVRDFVSAWTKVMNADRFDLPQNLDSVEPIGVAEPAMAK